MSVDSELKIHEPRPGLYTVSRSSFTHPIPCDGAFSGMVSWTDSVEIKSGWQKTLHFRVDWESRGENHRFEDGFLRRELTSESFFVEIADLLEFARSHGSIIIDPPSATNPHFHVEIYDDYRE